MSLSKREIVITRLFDVPVERVWQAWSDPVAIKKWWGPKEYSSPMCTIDFRMGGKYHFCMRSPDGKDYWSTGIFQEIIPLKKIVFTDSFADAEGNVVPASEYGLPGDDWPMEMITMVQFEAVGETTRLTLTSTGHPAGIMSEMAAAGWNQSLDKLSESIH